MAKLIDFEQDDDKPFGVGNFHLDDGSSYYLDDPERARSFLSEVTQQSDDIARSPQPLSLEQRYDNAVAKLAGGPNAPQLTPKAFDPDKLNPMRRAVAGPGGTEDESSLSSQPEPEENQSSADIRSRDDGTTDEGEADDSGAGAGASRTPSEEELRSARAVERATNAARVVASQPRVTGGVDPVRLQREGVPVDRSVTRKGGLPMAEYNQQAQDRATAYGYTNDVLAQNQQNEQAARLLEYEQLQAQTLAQRQANDKQALEIQRKQTKYEQDRAWLDEQVDSYYDKHKPDPDRIFKERGVFSNLAAAIAQFMGAYASIVSGSPNFASQILDKKIERDVDAQIEDFRRGKMKLDGQLQRMAERGMSIEQMKAALRLQQEKVVEKEAKAAALADGSRESMAAYQALMAQRQETFVKEENKFRTEALGETTTQADVVRPQAPRQKTALELLREQRDLLKTENEVAYEAGGGAAQEREDIRADKRAADEAKQGTAQTQRLTDYGNRRAAIEPAAKEAQTAAERLAAIKEKYGHLPGVGTWDLLGPNTTLGEQRQRFLQAFGVEQAEVAGEVQQLLSQLKSAAMGAVKGSASEGDVAREAEAMMGPNQSEEQVLRGVQRLTQRAITPLEDLNATYQDVLPQWQEQHDQELLRKRRQQKEQEELKKKGKVY